MASSVDLGNQLDSFVKKLVKAGRYGSRSEVLREGVRLIHERETHLAALDASIMRGVADAEAGRVHDIDAIASRLDAKYAAMSDKHGNQ
ncbi:type II toxin-antitoxin system ParD family antitoxin [Novosphingobium album (ex Liu et al. 2023)]|uniref:Type II toxin-antitoxin system ParD family antitoxin n=1 Tax=Novosphingobium album (ex Liu et al. 2023) TaxID=3031130 RepID=A0ABT5WUZ1_9SPHN|nr:type II toxin-antitoxin system ParD family antitoxin [Novosphingobium album (ex Liu et al. 2023)]MDE8653725.1 type II toxin-antitoxin system ParD family antitoxin [Novosphingobium album (ex Liu et al. 2023)]